jgi:CrcB protein
VPIRPEGETVTPPAGWHERQRRVGGPADLRLALMLSIGGAAGALARLELTRLFPFAGHGWPWATFVANVAGTLLLAYLFTRLQERLPPTTYRRPLLTTGFCGALTTFSTLNIEVLKLAKHGHAGLAIGYGAASLALGLTCVFAVTALTRRAGLIR